jgi:hypothetical protein
MVQVLFGEGGGAFAQGSEVDLRRPEDKLQAEGDVDPFIGEGRDEGLLAH